MRKLDLEQNSPEWEIFRRRMIGASDSPIICGVNPYKTPIKLWEEKALNQVAPINRAMMDGHRLEPTARKLAEEVIGCKFEPLCVLHESIPYLMASLDGYNPECGPYGGIHVEIKIAGDKVFNQAKEHGPLKYWIYQVNHQMECIGTDVCFIFVMHKETQEFLQFREWKSEDIVSEILEKAEEFHKRLVNFDRPKDKYKERDDEDWRMAAESFLRAKISLNTAEEYLNLCKQHLIEISGGECCRGCGVSTMKRDVKGAIDYSKVPELKNLDLEKYRKTSREEWRVT